MTRGAGTLSSEGIQALVRRGAIARDGDEPEVGQSTLRLHVGDIAWRPTALPRERRVVLKAGRELLLKPGEMVTVVTQERLDLPPDVVGCIYPRGRVLPLGLLVPTTYIDPAFHGHLRLIVMNLAQHGMKVPYGYELARASFEALQVPAPLADRNVNVDLQHLNPQADELAFEVSDAQVTAILDRLSLLEAAAQAASRRRRRHRRGVAVAAGAGGSLLVIAGAVAAALTLDAQAELAGGLAVVTIVGVIAAWRSRLSAAVRVRIARWIRR
jgi:dUTPase